MRWNRLAVAVLTICTGAQAAVAAPRAVLELFTSPFCSSCPPADELFVKLASQPDLITLVMPVDSWDRPGRKDALAKPEFTERQSAYADVRNEDSLYTPQAMVNGAAEAMGSDPGEIKDAIAQTAGVLSVPVKATVAGTEIAISVGAAKRAVEGGAMITMLPFMTTREIPMRRGETLHYANLVRDIVPVGRWEGKPVKQKLQLKDTAHYDGVVVLLQAGTAEKPGAILGAARVLLRAKAAALPTAQNADN
jgi:hypothetical protein